MTEKPLSQAEQQHIREKSNIIRTVAKVMKAVVRKHYSQAIFENATEARDVFNVENVRFVPAAPSNDNTTIRPAFAVLSFTIGPENMNESSNIETVKQGLSQDLELLFGAVSGNSRFGPNADTMQHNHAYTGTATVFGTPEELYDKMQQTMAEHTELRYLLPRTVNPR